MELSTLRFIVETKDLEEAAKKIDALGVSVSKLNKPMQAMSTESAKANKELSKAEEAAAKAALAQTKLEQAQNKGAQAASKSTSVLERQNLILEYMAQGNSKGQASILATAKAAGALDEDMLALNKTLVTQRTLIGGDPFDKSIGLMQKLQNEYKITTEVTTLFNKNLGLTQKQMTDLAREKERLIALYAIEGKDIKGLTAEYDQLIQKSKEINTANDARNNGMKSQIKAQADAAKANAYLADVDARLAAALDVTNKSLDKQSTDALVKYQKALKTAGLSADEAATKLAAAKTQFEQIADKKQADKLQYLARAISVQMGDVGISLASGMNPLLVMIQQGDQIRGAIQQAGAKGKDLERAMAGAATQIAKSFLQTGQAIGGFFVNAIKSAATAIFALPIETARYAISSLTATTDVSAQAFERLKIAAMSLAKVGIVAIVLAIAGLAVGLYDVIKQQDALTTQLVLTGASLGLNTALANQYAASLNTVGVNSSFTLKTIAAMAKEGGFLAKEITMVVKAADNLKLANVSVEDTVKQFSKLKEKPVDALIEIAKNTGLVKPEIIALVSELEQQGKTSEAAAIAMKAYADVTIEQKERLKEELNGFAVFMKTLSTEVADFFDSVFKNLFRKADPSAAIEKQIQQINETLNGGFFVGGVSADALKKQKNALVEQLMLLDQQKVIEISANNDRIRTAKILETVNKQRQDVLSNEEKRNREVRKAEIEHAFLINKGLMNQAESEKIIANIKDKYKDPAKPKEKTGLDYYQSTLLAITRLTNTSVVSQYELNKAQLKMLEVIDDPRFQKEPLKKQQEILQRLANASVILDEAEALEELRKQNIKVTEEYIKQQKVKDDLGISALDNSIALNKAVKEESDELLFQSTLLRKTDVERKKAIKTRQSELTLARELRDIEGLQELGFGVTKEGLRAQAEQRYLDRAKNINTEIAIDAATKTLEEYNKIADGLTDSIVTALIEGGESGGKKLRSILEAELRKPITVFVKAVVDILGSGINSAIGGKAGSTLGSTLGGAVGNLFSGSALGATLFGNSAAYGAAIGTTSVGAGSQAAMLAAQTGEFGAAGLSATAGSAGFGSSIYAAVPQIAAAIAIGNALGLFKSTKQVGGGISGILGASTPTSEVAMSGFLGKGRTRTVSNDIQQYALMREGGSLIDGPNYYRQTQGTFAGNAALQQAFNQLKASTKAMADTLKLSSAGVEDFTKTIDISFDGLTDTQIQEKIASTFASVNDELAALVLGAGATAEQLSTLYNNVMQQRYDLETQLLELQGKTLELRERERAKIYDANKGLFDQIKALEDQKAANEAAAVAMEKLTSVTTTIVDEINRLRGVSQTSSGLESQFAILTAQARSGDLTALAQLPEVTKGLEQIAASSAVNATDIIFARARLAQSLQDTLGYFPVGTLSTATTSVATLPSVATASAGASVSAASSNQELLAALVIEVQGLRAEVRADVSHNAKTAKILERVNQDGESLTVSTLV